VNEEVAEVLETARLKEVASSAMYRRAAAKASEPSTATLLQELAAEEDQHLAVLKNIQPETIIDRSRVLRSRISDLKIAGHLKAPAELPGAELTETLLFAIKQEADSVALYTDLMGIFQDATAKNLCQALAWQELAHKSKLEMLYDSIAYIED